MAIEKDKTLEDFKPEAEGVKNLIHEREVARYNDNFRGSKPQLFAWAIVASVLIIVLVYFLLPSSKVKAVSVSGTNYLTNDQVEEISGITYNSRYFLTFPNVIEKRVNESPMIESCKVKLLKNNIIQIIVVEKEPVGYRYEDDVAYILFSDGSKTELTSSLMNLVSRIPFIVGFTTDEQTHLLTSALAKVDASMLEEISEIRQYSLEYDDETLEIQMREGGYFFTDYYSIELINRYHETYVQLENKDYCIYAEGSGTNILSGRACPWDETTITHEYWLDENGDYIYNKWGDAAVKHYYTDENGLCYEDEEGNCIVIPIDSSGTDVEDSDFLEHFEAGYYATGELVIPEEDLVEDDETSEETDTSE